MNSVHETMETLAKLRIGLACREVVLRAAACMDANDVDAFVAHFAADAVLQRPGAEPLFGRDAIGAAYAQRPQDRLTRHLITNQLVDFESPGSVRVRSYVLLWTGSSTNDDSAAGRRADARQPVGEFDDHLAFDSNKRWVVQRRVARVALHRDA